MGRILRNTRLTQENIQHYISQATEQYSTFLDSAPLFCTYYSKNHLSSTYDRSLENVHEIIGADSPIKFNKVENLPIYKLDTASFETQVTDFGVTGDLSSSCILLPNTVKPMVDDVFFISSIGGGKLFLVTDVVQDNINNNKYYKITFKLSTFAITDVNTQTKETYTVDYNQIGKVDSPIILKSHFELAIQLEDLYDGIVSDYVDDYYSDEIHLFVDTQYENVTGGFLIDNYLNEFITTNKLHKKFYMYRSDTFLDYTLIKGKANRNTKKLLEFGVDAFYTGEPSKSFFTQAFNVRVLEGLIASKYSPSWFSAKKYYQDKVMTAAAPTDIVITTFSSTLKDAIVANAVTAQGLTTLEVFLVKHYNGYYKELDVTLNSSNYSEILQNLAINDSNPNNYYIVPFVLLALRHYHRILLSK